MAHRRGAVSDREPEPGPEGPRPKSPIEELGLGNIVTGLNWNTVNQVSSVLIYLGLTPFMLTTIGVDRYGLYALVSSFRGLLSNLDLGLGTTAQRFFSFYAGAKDRRSTAGLLVTMSVLLTVVVGVLAVAIAVVAPDITSIIHVSKGMRNQSTWLIRLFMPLLVIQAVRSLFQRIVMAEHRWSFYNITSIASTLVYAGVTAGLLEAGFGLTGIVWACYLQEAVVLIASIAGARPAIMLRYLRFLPRTTTKELIRYGLKVQISAVAASFNNEIDALLVGLLFPVRYVSYYSIGSNFAGQLTSLPTNAISPVSVTLARTFGESGLRHTLEQFTALQRMWVRLIAAFPLIGAASAFFAISRWLGPRAGLAPVVAVVMLVGQELVLISQVMDVFGKSVNRPDLESRYLALGMVVNIATTVPLAFAFGMIGVPTGTVIGEIVSVVYFLRIARREIDADLPSFFREIPQLATALAIIVTLVLEIPAYHLAPRGAFGVVTCAVPAAFGLGAYVLATFGVREPIRWIAAIRSAR